MNKKLIVLYCNSYNFTDERTGELRDGVSYRYILADNLAPANNQNGSKGYSVLKGNLPLSELGSFKAVPGLYDATLDIREKNGSTVLVPVALNFVSELTL